MPGSGARRGREKPASAWLNPKNARKLERFGAVESRAPAIEGVIQRFLSYKGESIGEKRLDFVIGGKLVVELKAVDEISSVHKSQVLTYLKITGLPLGILINFNTSLLKDGIKRIIQT